MEEEGEHRPRRVLWGVDGKARGPLARFTEPQKVLDHGFVQLLDVMGDDEAIEEAARVSYQAGTRKVSDRRGLIRYLGRHRHTTPVEMVEMKIRVKLPIFVERQWIRHRTASTNEMSARYSELPEEFYVPVAEQVCHQDRTNKQGRAEPLDEVAAESFRQILISDSGETFDSYRTSLASGVARETARIGLPLGTYTEKVWKIDAHNLLHFLSLRLDPHAQWEIRQYAEAIAAIVREWLPLTWEAFVDYRLEGCSLSRMEVEVLRSVVRSWMSDEEDLNPSKDRDGSLAVIIMREHASQLGMSKREVDAFVARFVYEGAKP
jgi:thymidylate synthase (FAD)